MKFIRELLLLESKHGDDWLERFRRARDVTDQNSSDTQMDELYYYRHKMFDKDGYELWYFSDHQPMNAPMDIAALHDDPEVQDALRAKIGAPERLVPMETFVAFHDGHSYAMWDDTDGNGMFAMVDWEAKEIPSYFDTQMRNLFDTLDSRDSITTGAIQQYIDLVVEAY